MKFQALTYCEGIDSSLRSEWKRRVAVDEGDYFSLFRGYYSFLLILRNEGSKEAITKTSFVLSYIFVQLSFGPLRLV